MKRKDFLKRALLGVAAAAISPKFTFANAKRTSTYDKSMERLVFNNLPNKELKQ